MTDLPTPDEHGVLYILDLHCWMHRFFATMGGRAAHGFIEFVGKILRRYEPTHFLVCRDLPGGGTFRHELLKTADGSSTYKGTRPPPDPTLLERIRWAHELLEDTFGIPVYGLRGFEADDLIAAFAKQAKQEHMQVVIVGLDKDLMQLVDERCVMWDGKKQVVGPPEVEERFGVRPDQLRDYLAIVGDGVDNVPGIHGAGPKAAVEILREFGTLEEALQCARAPYSRLFFDTRPRYREMLRAQRDTALLSQRLVSLADDAPVKLNTKEAARCPP